MAAVSRSVSSCCLSGRHATDSMICNASGRPAPHHSQRERVRQTVPFWPGMLQKEKCRESLSMLSSLLQPWPLLLSSQPLLPFPPVCLSACLLVCLSAFLPVCLPPCWLVCVFSCLLVCLGGRQAGRRARGRAGRRSRRQAGRRAGGQVVRQAGRKGQGRRRAGGQAGGG